jgi:hypothetical protein
VTRGAGARERQLRERAGAGRGSGGAGARTRGSAGMDAEAGAGASWRLQGGAREQEAACGTRASAAGAGPGRRSPERAVACGVAQARGWSSACAAEQSARAGRRWRAAATGGGAGAGRCGTRGSKQRAAAGTEVDAARAYAGVAMATIVQGREPDLQAGADAGGHGKETATSQGRRHKWSTHDEGRRIGREDASSLAREMHEGRRAGSRGGESKATVIARRARKEQLRSGKAVRTGVTQRGFDAQRKTKGEVTGPGGPSGIEPARSRVRAEVFYRWPARLDSAGVCACKATGHARAD